MSDLNCADCEPETGGAYCGACDIGHTLEGVREEAKSRRRAMQPLRDEVNRYKALARELATYLFGGDGHVLGHYHIGNEIHCADDLIWMQNLHERCVAAGLLE